MISSSIRKVNLSILNVFLLVAFLVATAVPAVSQASQSVITWKSEKSLDRDQKEQVEAFIQELEETLPRELLDQVSFELPFAGKFNADTFRPIQIVFKSIPGTSKIEAPNCEAEMVDKLDTARINKGKYIDAVKNSNLRGIRYHGQIQSGLNEDNEIVVADAFLPIIFNGEARSQKFACGHRSLYQVAQASIVHGIARLYDESEYASVEQKLSVEDKNGQCEAWAGYARNSTVPMSLANPQDRRVKRAEAAPETLRCLDLEEAQTLISERMRYRILAGEWAWGKSTFLDESKKKKKLKKGYFKNHFAFWPRAVNPYSYAYDVKTHFAYNMEFFLLDPEYACRKPVLFEHISEQLGSLESPVDPHKAIENGICEINTELRLTKTYPDYEKGGDSIHQYKTYDLDPKRVSEINYFLAAEGKGAASSFGHSMFRVVGCPEGITDPEQCRMHSQYDIVLNHRANPLELRLDSMKGIFGGYPSQLFVSTFKEIHQEYGSLELRHLYNMPLGYTINGEFQDGLNDRDKARFLYKSLEQYWGYMGSYKFISNNCADEAMRLFRNTSEDINVWQEDILTPNGIAKRLEARGVLDKKELADIKSKGIVSKFLSKIPLLGRAFAQKPKAYNSNREIIESSERVDESKMFSFHDAVAYFMDLDGVDVYNQDGDVKKLHKLKKEIKKWMKLGTMSKDGSSICKLKSIRLTPAEQAKVMEKTMGEAIKRYHYFMNEKNLDENGNESLAKMLEINQNFYRIIVRMKLMRMKAVGDMAIQGAYEIGFPDNGKEKSCKKAANDWAIDANRKAQIEAAITNYSELQHRTMAFSKDAVVPGYGIPFYEEVKMGSDFLALQQEAMNSVNEVIEVMQDEMGVDYEMMRVLDRFSEKIKADRARIRCEMNPNGRDCKAEYVQNIEGINHGISMGARALDASIFNK